jgi:DNA mismatch repair ATPase MutS
MHEHSGVLAELDDYVRQQRERLREPRIQLTYASGGTARPKPQLEIPTTSKAHSNLPAEYTPISNTSTVRRFNTAKLHDIEVKLAHAAEQLEATAQNVLRRYCTIFALHAHVSQPLEVNRLWVLTFYSCS